MLPFGPFSFPDITISLDLKFIGTSKVGDEIVGHVRILKKTKTLVFLFCELKCNDEIITTAVSYTHLRAHETLR